MTVSDVLIVSVTAAAVFFDFHMRRIPNWLILFGLAAGLILHSYQGFDQLSYSVLGLAAGIAILLIPFALGWIGAGDVKLFGVVGALLGLNWLPRVFFYSAVVAGLIAVGYVLVGRFNSRFFADTWADWKIALLTLGRVLPEPITIRASKGAHSVPWGVAFGIGTIWAYYLDPHGSWAGF